MISTILSCMGIPQARLLPGGLLSCCHQGENPPHHSVLMLNQIRKSPLCVLLSLCDLNWSVSLLCPIVIGVIDNQIITNNHPGTTLIIGHDQKVILNACSSLRVTRIISDTRYHIKDHLIIFLWFKIFMTMQERLFIGTPGSYYWQGQGYSMNLLNR